MYIGFISITRHLAGLLFVNFVAKIHKISVDNNKLTTKIPEKFTNLRRHHRHRQNPNQEYRPIIQT